MAEKIEVGLTYRCPLCHELASLNLYQCYECNRVVCDECVYSRPVGYICAECREHKED